MKKKLCALLLLLVLLAPTALADGYVPLDYSGAETTQRTAVIVARNVTLRTLPSYDGDNIASIPGETVVEVLGQDAEGRWLQVRYLKSGSPLTGWILAEYAVQNPMTLILRDNNVPAYAAPSRQAKKVGSLPAYTRLTVIGEWEDYYVVSLRNAAACIRKDAYYWTDWTLHQYENSGQRLTLRVTTGTTLRTGAGTDWVSAGKVSAGTMLEALSAYDENGWYVVRFNDGDIAYVRATDVEIVGSSSGAVG